MTHFPARLAVLVAVVSAVPVSEAQDLIAANGLTIAPAAESATSSSVDDALTLALASADPAVRAAAVGEVAARVRNGVPALSPEMAPALIDIYKSAPDDSHRMTALQALSMIGDDASMTRVRRLVYGQRSRMVKAATVAVLVDYFKPESFRGDWAFAGLMDSLHIPNR